MSNHLHETLHCFNSKLVNLILCKTFHSFSSYFRVSEAGFRQRFMMNTAKAALNDEVSIVNSGM